MSIKNKKHIFFSLLIANSSVPVAYCNSEQSLSPEAAPTSVYLEDSIELLSSIDFNIDTQEDIDNKLAEAQKLLSKAQGASKLKSITFTEVKE